MTITIGALHIYPVKSLGGVSLKTSDFKFGGLQLDRQYLVTQPDGIFITQRTHPQMALVGTTVVKGCVQLASFGLEPVLIPQVDAAMPHLKADVWGDAINGIDLGDHIANWLTQAIDTPCRLLAFPLAEQRPCDQTFSRPGDHTWFSDAFPLLIISRASLDDLNQRLLDKGSRAVSMNRFRPNIVVEGCEAFAEDQWKEIRINDLPIRVVKPCARCSVPTVDPDTGALAGPEPIHTLNSYRERGGEVFFGMNAIGDAEGVISIGDTVELIS